MPNTTYNKICPQCNITFLTAVKKKKFCSKECYAKWRSENLKGENNPQFNPNKKKTICKNCQKEFYSPDKTRKFCCLKCSNDYHKGENSPVRNNNLKTLICPVCKTTFRQKRIT